MGMVAAGTRCACAGNHEAEAAAQAARPQRAAHPRAGRDAGAARPRSRTSFGRAVAGFLDSLISHYVLDGGRLVVAHAGLKEAYQGRASGRVRSFCLYGDTTGETDEYGLPVRYPWAKDYRGSATVVYGHTPTPEPEWVNNTICVDTGCVFGGALTALRYPTRELVSVPAATDLLRAGPPAGRRPHRRPRRTPCSTWPTSPAGGRIDTGYGRVTVAGRERRRRAGGDGPVRGRPALAAVAAADHGARARPPRWTGYLEHPAEAFADYRAAGRRAGRVRGEAHGLAGRGRWSQRRAGRHRRRRRLHPHRPAVLRRRRARPRRCWPGSRAAADAAGLLDELDTDWLLLDAELLPWSAKAAGLIREQYASVGAAGRAALPAALAVLDAAAGRGLRRRRAARPAGRPARTRSALHRRRTGATAGRPTGWTGCGWRRSPCSPRPGPATPARDHGWHLGTGRPAGRGRPGAVRADPPAGGRPDRRGAVAEATEWWLTLTAAGGEGMVVKPYAGLGPAAAGTRLQPGIKCRGREYLRIIYGPGLHRAGPARRLRGAALGRKRGLALREHALGLAALDRAGRRASRCGASTSWSSRSWPASPSRSTPASDRARRETCSAPVPRPPRQCQARARYPGSPWTPVLQSSPTLTARHQPARRRPS